MKHNNINKPYPALSTGYSYRRFLHLFPCDLNGEIYLKPAAVWDINEDGQFNILDLTRVANAFGTVSPSNPRVDVNEDGQINILDLVSVSSHFGETVSMGRLFPE